MSGLQISGVQISGVQISGVKCQGSNFGGSNVGGQKSGINCRPPIISDLSLKYGISNNRTRFTYINSANSSIGIQKWLDR